MLVAIPRETDQRERRVAAAPANARRMIASGFDVIVVENAGAAAGFESAEYTAAGAEVVTNQADLSRADLVAVVGHSGLDHVDIGNMAVVGLLEPLDRPDRMERLASTGATILAFELIPRVTRAQAMDALSSQATAAGYHATILAAQQSPRFFPMLTTAAGTVRPARVLVLGAGVAGLQAIATSRRLGARVFGYDVRAGARGQVESLGAAFVELDLEPQDASASGGYAQELETEAQRRQLSQLAAHTSKADVIITAAAIPGRPAPVLLTKEMIEDMPAGAVVIDGAAATGGNCELTKPDELVRHGGITILGPTNLPSGVPGDASEMYGRNVQAVVEHVTGPDGLVVDTEDEITAGCLVAQGGEVVHPRVRDLLGLA